MNSQGQSDVGDGLPVAADRVITSGNQFNIEIKLRSASKAAKNDPRPPGDWLTRFQRHEAGAAAEDIDMESDSDSDEDAEENDSAASEHDDEEEQQDSGEDIEEDDDSASENDEFAEWDWMEEMEGFVTCVGDSIDVGKPKEVGYCEAKLIRRARIGSIFHHEMEQPSEDTSDLAFEVFDRYGRLKTEFKGHPVRKGTGVWKDELDTGDLLLIEFLRIEKEYRSCGLGKKLVMAMVDKTRQKSESFFTVAEPAFLNVRDRDSELEAMTDAEKRKRMDVEAQISRTFFRSLGFRRIGSSCHFGLANDPDHPSRHLTASDDYERTERRDHIPESEYHQLQKSLVGSDDLHCVEMLEQALEKTSASDPSWLVVDKEGNTLLHLAALTSKPKAVDWIMNNASFSHMLEIRNDEGDTPLDALLMHLDESRTRREIGMKIQVISDLFKGHGGTAALSLARLKGLTEPTANQLARLSFGCTCGQCVGGFLSPRMSLALLCQAEPGYDMLSYDNQNGPLWVEEHDDYLEYVPKRVRNNLEANKSMRQGFANLCKHIATCLNANILPTQENVLSALDNASEWPPMTRNFLQRGGTVACVASKLFEMAMQQDELAGDGEHREIFGDGIDKLPTCRNDHEFGFVSGMCGYKRVSNIQYVSLRDAKPIEEEDIYS